MQREGKYPLPQQASKTIMGVEFSGIVSKLGSGASKFKEGDEVFGLAYGVCHVPTWLREKERETNDREHTPSILLYPKVWSLRNQRK